MEIKIPIKLRMEIFSRRNMNANTGAKTGMVEIITDARWLHQRQTVMVSPRSKGMVRKCQQQKNFQILFFQSPEFARYFSKTIQKATCKHQTKCDKRGLVETIQDQFSSRWTRTTSKSWQMTIYRYILVYFYSTAFLMLFFAKVVFNTLPAK